MSAAYEILGLRAHHGLNLMDLPEQWMMLEQAAEATWPDAPKVRPRKPFTRADWDKIFGNYDAITDVASTFADQLVLAYPDAKVVVVERDPVKWEKSFNERIIDPIFGPIGIFAYYIIIPIVGNRGLDAMRKILFGYFGARDAAGIRERARAGYERYYTRIRELVPPERRLEYKLGDGWKPLCDFLGTDPPKVDFPWVNEAAAHDAKQKEQLMTLVLQAWGIAKPWIGIGAAAVCLFGATWLAKGHISITQYLERIMG
jgi:hypothetical protein